MRRSVNAAGNAIGTVAQGAAAAVGGAVGGVANAWSSGDFRSLGRMAGATAVAFVPIGGVLTKVGAIGLLASAGRTAATGLARGSGAISRALAASRSVKGAASKAGTSCARIPHSFSPATLVLTAAGLVTIGSLAVGDEVLAYDGATGATGSYPITAVHVHDDPVTGTVVIDGETIETTPEHPFSTTERGWTEAGDLRPGMHIPSADGSAGIVESVAFGGRPAVMYDLTVAVAHTYFVGEQGWLVHNTNGCPLTGRYGTVGGHHPHAQAAFLPLKPKYKPREAFAVSDEALESVGTTHKRVTREQNALFRDAVRSGRRNTMRLQNEVAREAMRRAGVPKAIARRWQRMSTRSLKRMKISRPVYLPYSGANRGHTAR